MTTTKTLQGYPTSMSGSGAAGGNALARASVTPSSAKAPVVTTPAVSVVPNSAKQTVVTLGSDTNATFENLIQAAKQQSLENSAKAQEMAEAQWKFNAEEAEKNRQWQEYMSSTAHRREVEDLIAAGLNPVLSAGGNGAAVTSGSQASGSAASPDTGATNILGSYLTALINSATQISSANISANALMSEAAMYTQMNKYLTQNYPNNPYQLIAQVFGGVDNFKKTVSGFLDTFKSKDKRLTFLEEVLANFLSSANYRF